MSSTFTQVNGDVSTSPGVYTREILIPSTSSNQKQTIATFVGFADRGVINQRYLCSSERDVIAMFGEPDVSKGYGLYAALEYVKNAPCYFTRVNYGDSLTACANLTVDQIPTLVRCVVVENVVLPSVSKQLSGVILTTGDLIILNGQTDKTENGVHTVTITGTTASLIRTPTLNIKQELLDDTFIVTSGNSLSAKAEPFIALVDGLTVDSDANIRFIQMSQAVIVSYAVSDPITLGNLTITLGKVNLGGRLITVGTGFSTLLMGQTDSTENGVYNVAPISASLASISLLTAYTAVENNVYKIKNSLYAGLYFGFIEQANGDRTVRGYNSVLDEPYIGINTKSNPNIMLTTLRSTSDNSKTVGIWNPESNLNFTKGVDDTTIGAFYCRDPGVWNNGVKLRVRPYVTADMVGVAGAIPLDSNVCFVDVLLNGNTNPTESFLVSFDYRTNGYGQQLNINEVINNQSDYIRWKQNPYSPTDINVATTTDVALSGGTSGRYDSFDNYADGSDSSAFVNLINASWSLYANNELVTTNLLVAAGLNNPDVIMHMINIASTRLDCIVIYDIPTAYQDIKGSASLESYADNALNPMDSSQTGSYASPYTPDVEILDPYNNRWIYVPPTVKIAALYPKVDKQFGDWFAVSGMTRGALSGIRNVRYTYDQDDRDRLDSLRVNPIRVLTIRNQKYYSVWGVSTNSIIASPIQYQTVRRLLNRLETVIGDSSLYSVFEPNTEILRGIVTSKCKAELEPIKMNSGISWYAVICDSTNNDASTVMRGGLNVDVYLDVVIIAKRIHLNTVITRTGEITKAISTITAERLVGN